MVKPEVEKDLKYVGDAITLTRHKLEGKVPLIGFTGAPVSIIYIYLIRYILTSIYNNHHIILVDIDGLYDSRWW